MRAKKIMQICFLITKYEQIVKLEHLLCPKGGGHKRTCAPPPLLKVGARAHPATLLLRPWVQK